MTRGQVKHGDRRRQSHRGSFTLVEMLVAIAILAILMVLLLGMTGSLSTLWQSGQAHNERRTDTQAIFDRMTRDLQQVAVPASRNGNPAFVNATSLQMVINPTGVGTQYEYPQSLFWQAPVATDGATNGNLSIVGYFVQWVNGAPVLSRYLVNPSTSSYYTVYSSPGSWISSSSIAANAASTANGYQGLMSPNVLGIWFQALDGNGNPILQTGSTIQGESFNSQLGYAYTNYLYTNGGLPVISTNAPCAIPAAIQVAIVIIDSATARHLTASTSTQPTPTSLTGNFWSDVQGFYANLPPVIRKGAEIQTTTVELSNGPR